MAHQFTTLMVSLIGNSVKCDINFSLGLAYFGRSQLNGSTGIQTNITFATSDDTITPWSIAANSTSVTFNETQYMYIIPSSGGFEQVGFATNASVPTGGVTSGFACK